MIANLGSPSNTIPAMGIPRVRDLCTAQNMAATVSARGIFCDWQMALTRHMLQICCISNIATKPKKKAPVICSSFINVEQKVVYMIMRRITLLRVENGIFVSVDDDMMLECFVTCPTASGRTTVTKSFEKIDAIGTSAEPPVTFITSRGVIITPRKAPIVPLNMAAASLPSVAFVSMRPVLTGGGRHDNTFIPMRSDNTSPPASTPIRGRKDVSRNPARTQIIKGVTRSENP
mmetsp:Transcript_19479/g.27436  ORF Transcript_19479/g.27436 Transcript_19479/m.27436 type:complete len:232 (-) Transcript_19479:392-1087(-)